MDVLMVFIGIILFLIYLHYCGKQKHPVRSMLINSLSGVAALMAAAAVTGFAGCAIAVNYATVFVSCVLGIPGAAAVLLTALVI